MNTVVLGGYCVTVVVIFTVCNVVDTMVGVTCEKMINSGSLVVLAFESLPMVEVLEPIFWDLSRTW